MRVPGEPGNIAPAASFRFDQRHGSAGFRREYDAVLMRD